MPGETGIIFPSQLRTEFMAPDGTQPCSSGIQFLLNGKFQLVENPDPNMLLSEYIRGVAGLKGTKVSCAQGGCGACTVVVSPIDYSDEGRKMNTSNASASDECLVYRPVNSCLKPLCSVDGMSVTTVEGVGSVAKGMHNIQKKLSQHNGSQCGFCTPGFVMSMYGLAKENPSPTAQQVEDQFDGNLCRCTGYRPILDGFQDYAASFCSPTRPSGVQSCTADIEDLCRGLKAGCGPKQPMQTPQPPSTGVYKAVSTAGGVSWIRPHSLDSLCGLLQEYSSAGVRMVVGNTATGVYEAEKASVLLDISQVPELKAVSVDSSGVSVGGALAIADVMRVLQANESLSSSYAPLVKHMYRVANHQVRNVGSLSGNLMLTRQHPEFVSDIATILMAAGVTLTLVDALHDCQVSTLPLDDFFSLPHTATAGVVIKRLTIPALSANEKFVTQKVALRRVNAHAFVNAGFRFRVEESSGVIVERPTIVFGGVKEYPQRAKLTEEYLAGKSFMDQDVVQNALGLLSHELVPDPKFLHTKYRASLIPAFLFKSMLRLWPTDKLPPQLQSAAADYERPISSGDISFDEGDPSLYPATLPIPKLSENIQSTGEAVYVDDVSFVGELHAALVLTAYGNAGIESVDAGAAMEAPGVHAFISSQTLRKDGYCNVVSESEELFCSKRSLYCGQALGMILANTKKQAEAAAKLVSVKYTDIQKPILSCDEAVTAGAFFPDSKAVLKQGDALHAIENGEVVVSGSTSVGHQYHFHMETQRCVCVPGEDGTMEVHASTQNPSQVQAGVANALNKPQHKVKVVVRRVGGAYGAKINRATPVAMACAVAADSLNRPVRLLLDLSTNMKNVGGRSPYQCTYRMSATRDGIITGIHMRVLNDQGAHYDLDPPSGDIFLMFLDNVYKCENWDVEYLAVRTNLPACTYMRGPAFVEGLFMMESMVEHCAAALGMPPDEFRYKNMYRPGDVSPTGQHLRYCNARPVFDKLRASSAYHARVAAVASFNAANLFVKRGIALVPVRFALYWQGYHFSALLNVYPDASVSVLQSGAELGQGLYVKVAQVAAMALGKPTRGGGLAMEAVRVGTVSTDVANNVGSTGSSTTSELCAMATLEACNTLVERLAPISRQLALQGGGTLPTWHELIGAAVEAGVDLQSRGNVNPPPSDLGTFQYMSYGAAVTEAEVDILTGDTRLLQADLLLDCGKSLNPAVDIGQTQGAYVMGIGYFLSEDFVYDTESLTGELISDGTWEYKPPSHKDIPHVFNTSLLQNSGNPSGFLRSKASGEPPYAMASSALLAVRRAVEAGRLERGDTRWVPLSSPATVDKVAMAAAVPRNLLLVNAQ